MPFQLKGSGLGGGAAVVGASSVFKYLVLSDGGISTTAKVYSRNGAVNSGASAAMINWCYNNLSAGRLSPEVIQLMGEFSIETPVLATKYSWLRGPAKLKAKTNLNNNIIALKTPTDTIATFLSDFDVDGNRTNNTSGHGVYLAPDQDLVYTDPEPYRTVIAKNIKIREADDRGLYVNATNGVNCGSIRLEQIQAHECDSYGIQVDDSTDTEIIDCYTAGMYLDHMTSGRVAGCYCGNIGALNSVTVTNCQRVRISDLKLDSFSYHGLFIDNGCRSIQLNNVEAKVGSQLDADNTYDAILLNDASYCLLTNITVHQTSGSNKVRYCINEIAPSDYNVVCGAILEDGKTAAKMMKLVGANSEYSAVKGTVSRS